MWCTDEALARRLQEEEIERGRAGAPRSSSGPSTSGNPFGSNPFSDPGPSSSGAGPSGYPHPRPLPQPVWTLPQAGPASAPGPGPALHSLPGSSRPPAHPSAYPQTPPRSYSGDEALAKALQEELNRGADHAPAGGPPVNAGGGTALMGPTTAGAGRPAAAVAAGPNDCAGCGRPIGFFGGRYLEAQGRRWHPDCLR